MTRETTAAMDAAAERERSRRLRLCRLRAEAFQDIPAALWRFDTAAETAQLRKARNYAAQWEAYREKGLGLLLFGNVGTGKSYAAGCIANALLDRGISVRFTGTVDVVSRMQGSPAPRRDACMEELLRPELLILDDLGAERSTTFGKERVFDVVNRRIQSCKPLIITTNLPLTAMQNASELEDRRIYDRILERCVPVRFNGENFRKGNAKENLTQAASILARA